MTRALAAGVAEPAAAGLGAGLAAGPGLEVAEVALGFGPRAGRLG